MATFYLIRHGKHNYDSVSGKNFIGHGLELAPKCFCHGAAMNQRGNCATSKTSIVKEYKGSASQ